MLLLAVFVAQAVARLVALVGEPPPHLADWLLLVLATLGAAAGTGMVVLAWRARVTLTADGIEVREGRRRLVRYGDVVRAYRKPFERGAVSLELVDGRTLVLPAPRAGTKDAAPELDEAVALISTRLGAGRAGVGDGADG